jgi:rRNA maturation endonuclease Nob1
VTERDELDQPDELGGDPACWQAKVCQHCWRFVEQRPDDAACPFCGSPLEE